MSVAAPQPSRSHAALIWLIRGTFIVTAIFLAIFLLFILVAVPFSIIFRESANASNPMGYRLTMVFVGLILILFYGFIVKRNYHNFRKDFWKVNADTVANFSIVFALLLAIDWHHFLPPNLPQAIVHRFGSNGFLASLLEPGPGIHYRGVLSIIAFFLFNKLIKAYLMRVLDLNSPQPPQNPPPSDPDIPEFPKKSPLIQL